jgi:hypothetical protein
MGGPVSKQDNRRAAKPKQPINTQLDATSDKPPDVATPLKVRVYNALLAVLDDTRAPAAAKASACRTLLEYYGGDDRGPKGIDEMTAGELDAEINRVSGGPHS